MCAITPTRVGISQSSRFPHTQDHGMSSFDIVTFATRCRIQLLFSEAVTGQCLAHLEVPIPFIACLASFLASLFLAVYKSYTHCWRDSRFYAAGTAYSFLRCIGWHLQLDVDVFTIMLFLYHMHYTVASRTKMSRTWGPALGFAIPVSLLFLVYRYWSTFETHPRPEATHGTPGPAEAAINTPVLHLDPLDTNNTPTTMEIEGPEATHETPERAEAVINTPVLNLNPPDTNNTPTTIEMTEDDVLGSFLAAIRNVASVSLAIEYPTIVSVNHSLVYSARSSSRHGIRGL